MTPTRDAEHQTPAVSRNPRPPELTGEHYIMGHARRGWYAGERRGVPATQSGQGVAYAGHLLVPAAGYLVVRARHGTMPLDLLAWSSEELVLVKVRRARRVPPSLHAIADLYREEILTLRGLPDPEGSCCSYQFWLCVSCHGWRVFEVMKGGIREITRDI